MKCSFGKGDVNNRHEAQYSNIYKQYNYRLRKELADNLLKKKPCIRLMKQIGSNAFVKNMKT